MTFISIPEKKKTLYKNLASNFLHAASGSAYRKKEKERGKEKK